MADDWQYDNRDERSARGQGYYSSRYSPESQQGRQRVERSDYTTRSGYDGYSDRRSSERGSSGRGASERGAYSRGRSERGAYSRGASERAASSRSASSRGASRGASSRSASSRGTSSRSGSRASSSRGERSRTHSGQGRVRSSHDYVRSTSNRAASSRSISVQTLPTYSSAGGGRFDKRIIVLAVIAVVLIALIVFAVSTCAGRGEQSQSSASSGSVTATVAQTASSAAAAASSDSAASADAASVEASGESASAESASTAASTATAKAPVIAAEPGDVSYPVAQSAKLAYRDVDFAVDPNRRDWNFDKTNGHKTVYLTFDDGPSENTERALDILDEYGCKATFFVTGQNPDYFPWIKEAYDRGHTIGLHSMSHDYESCYASPEGFWQEFDAIGQVVKDQIGYVPCFIRFPGGSSNTISADYSDGIMSYLAEDVQSRGYQYFDWSLSCGDGGVVSTEEAISIGCEETDEENIVFLLHDGAAKETTIEALPTIIQFYQDRGYTFEALDRDTLVSHHGIAN